jgi:hypothetical protein
VLPQSRQQRFGEVHADVYTGHPGRLIAAIPNWGVPGSDANLTLCRKRGLGRE